MKLELVVLDLQLLVVLHQSIPLLSMLAIELLPLLDELLLHVVETLLSFFTADDRLAAGGPNTMEHAFVVLLGIDELLLLFIELELRELKLLLKHCLLLGPLLSSHVEGLFLFTDSLLQLSNLVLGQLEA